MGRLALAIPLVLLAGCGAADGAGVADCRFDASTCAHFEERAAQLQWVRTADAERDAEAAIAAGNPPIIGLYGYGAYFPGLPEGGSAEGCPTRMLAGTADYLDSETAELQALAETYAETYNREVWPHVTCQTRKSPPA